MARLNSGTRIFGTANVDTTLLVGTVAASNSSSPTSGSLLVTGGIGATGNIYAAGNVVVTSGINSTSNTTGALLVTGGAGISGNVWAFSVNTATTVTTPLLVASSITTNTGVFSGGSVATSNLTGTLLITNNGGLGVTGNIWAGNVYVANTGAATSLQTGVLQVAGGAAIQGNVYVGGNVVAGGIGFTDGSLAFSSNICATMAIVGGANGIYYFTGYAPRAMTIRLLNGQIIGGTGGGEANVTIFIGSSNVGGMNNLAINSTSSLLQTSTPTNNQIAFGSTVYASISNSSIDSTATALLTLLMN
jgi:hypothetical protein